jgi:hypothetical protein
MIAIAVAVGAILKVPLTNLIAFGATAAPAGATAGIAAGVAGGALAGVAGSVASQGFGIATGIQEEFSWKGVALAGISGGVAGGLSQFGALSEVGKITGTLGKVGRFLAATGAPGGAASGLVGNALGQGIGRLVGLQSKFDFAGLATAGVIGAASGAMGATLAGKGGLFGIRAGLGSSGNAMLSGTAGALAGAASRSLIEGTDFGDNLIAALPDVIGSTIGRLVAQGVTAQGSSGPMRRASTPPGRGASSLAGDDLSEPVIVITARKDRFGRELPTPENENFMRYLRDYSIGSSLSERSYRPGNVFLQEPARPTLQTYIRSEFRRAPRLHASSVPGTVSSISSYTPSAWNDMKHAVWGRQHQAYDQLDAGGLGYLTGSVEFVLSPVTGALDLASSYYRGRHGRVAPADRQTTDITLFAVGGAETMAAKLGRAGVAAETKLAGDLAPGFYRANPAELRFSQSTASPNFSKGGTINDLVADLNNGLRPEQVGGGPLQVVMRDGVPFSMDNRRLVAFNAAGAKDIPIEVVNLRDPSVAARFADRFDPIAGQGKMIVVVPNSGRTAAQQLLYDNSLIRRLP